MKKPQSPTILVLGAQGMLGRTVYTYLHSLYPTNTWGTVKEAIKNSDYFSFNAHSITSFKAIYKKLGKIDYLINCIGILRGNKDIKEMTFINAKFPIKLSLVAEENNSKLIHISTDAVFSPLEKTVTEDTPPTPTDIYGKTKLHGEPLSQNTITIRTSLLGFDPLHHKGLLEWALQSQKTTLDGFSDQIWSGCTTFQFAKFCELLIKTNTFQKMRETSPIFHFSPIGNVTKHAIIKTFLTLMKNKKTVTKKTSEPISRSLITNYPHLLFLDQQEKNIKDALSDLILFEKNYLNY